MALGRVWQNKNVDVVLPLLSHFVFLFLRSDDDDGLLQSLIYRPQHGEANLWGVSCLFCFLDWIPRNCKSAGFGILLLYLGKTNNK